MTIHDGADDGLPDGADDGTLGGGSNVTHMCGVTHRRDRDWLQAVDSWPWILDEPNSWHKEGKCPHCGHDITVKYVVQDKPG